MAKLEVNNLCKRFGETPVLRGVSFSLEQGQVLALIGRSGGGKTTLLRCLNALETPDSGAITLDGRPLRTGQCGLVFQSFNLFPQYTVLENVTLAPRLRKIAPAEQIRTKALELLSQMELTEKQDAYPCQLSGGQQQRVAIARALALEPEVLCLDEPTSALDPALTGEVQKRILSLKQRRITMVVATHEMGFARAVADVVCYLSEGRIAESGTPEAVFDHPRSEKTRAFLRNLEGAAQG